MKNKIRDFVTITNMLCGHEFSIGEIVKIKKVYTNDYHAYGLYDSDNWFITDEECVLATKDDMIRYISNKLLKANNTITTLEVKIELRTKFPRIKWNQSEIHDYFVNGVNNNIFEVVDDNGTYRTYASKNKSKTNKSMKKPIKVPISNVTVGTTPAQVISLAPTQTKSRKDNRISRTKAYEMMKNNKGRFFTATFIKKDNTERTINCQFLKDQTELNMGYVRVRESSKLKTNPKDATRQINLQTLKRLKIGGAEYKIRY